MIWVECVRQQQQPRQHRRLALYLPHVAHTSRCQRHNARKKNQRTHKVNMHNYTWCLSECVCVCLPVLPTIVMFWLARYQNTQVQCQICDSRRWRRSRRRRCRWQTRQWKCLSSALALKNKINTPHTLTERAQPRLLVTSFCHFVECERMRSFSPFPPSSARRT